MDIRQTPRDGWIKLEDMSHSDRVEMLRTTMQEEYDQALEQLLKDTRKLSNYEEIITGLPDELPERLVCQLLEYKTPLEKLQFHYTLHQMALQEDDVMEQVLDKAGEAQDQFGFDEHFERHPARVFNLADRAEDAPSPASHDQQAPDSAVDLGALDQARLHTLLLDALRREQGNFVRAGLARSGMAPLEYLTRNMDYSDIIFRVEANIPTEEQMREVLRFEDPLAVLCDHWEGDYHDNNLDAALHAALQQIVEEGDQDNHALATDRYYTPDNQAGMTMT